jgi:hypothetical protein
MATAMGLLIAPSLQHQIVDRGRATARIISATTRLASAALFPFALSLGINLYIVVAYRAGTATGMAIGIGFGTIALAAWFGTEWLFDRSRNGEARMKDRTLTSIDVRVEHMLTEARVLLPGAQALLGFQLAVMLTDAFAQLSEFSAVLHVIALCCIALTIVLLIAPAAFHRITFGGENTESFYRLGSALVVAAAVPLGAGIVFDIYVAVAKALGSSISGMVAAGVVACVLFGLWLIEPLLLRTNRKRAVGLREIGHDRT